MKLMDLFDNLDIIETNIENDIEINAITINSSKVTYNSLFICLIGTIIDGHSFIYDAIERGAAAVVVQKKPDTDDVPYILVKNTRITEALLWMRWYGEPVKDLCIIGITGTNGKTSIAYMIRQILKDAGYKSAMLGTIKYIIGDEEYNASLTTPDSADLAKLFRQIKDSGIKYVVMEVSSHSLELEKVAGLFFDIGIFTNLTQDHLDFHGTMENYLASKAKLFKKCGIAIINADDTASINLMDGNNCKKIYHYAIDTAVEFKAESINYKGVDGIEYDLIHNDKKVKINSLIPGKPYVYNTAAAYAAGNLLGIGDDIITGALSKVQVPGRLEKIDTNTDYSVFIDYAHTPDALYNLLCSIKNFTSERVITVFGCGGDRDKKKRPIMGRIAMDNSDYCVITSDNPRMEDSMLIIQDILDGIVGKTTPYKVISDRSEAIIYALSIAETGDVVLLVGKGHEEYIKDKKGTHHFSEKEIIFDELKKLKSIKPE